MGKSKQAIVLLSNPMTFDIRPIKTARSLSQNGFEVTALCWDRENNNPKTSEVSPNFHIRRFGLKTTYAQNSSKLLGFVFYYIWCIFESLRFKPEIIYCNDIDTLPLGLIIRLIKFRSRVIYDMHDLPHILVHDLPISGISEKLLFLIAGRYADHIIVVNDSFIPFLSNIGFDPKKITCIMNVSEIINTEINKHSTSNKLNIFYYGAISKVRGVDKLCKIVEGLSDINLILAGRGDMEKYVKKLSESKKNIQYIGWISQTEIDTITAEQTDLIAILSDRYYVQSPFTHTLSSPTKLFTGMALGIPVLVSEGAFMSQLVMTYNCGVVLDFKDLAKSRKELEYLRDTPSLRVKLGENGFNAAINTFNWAQMETRLTALWLKIVDKH